MNRKELVKLLTHISDIYRQFDFPKETDGESKRFVESWKEYLGNYDYEDAKKALRKWTETSSGETWPPNAPELKNRAEKIVSKRERLKWVRKQEKAIENGNHPELEPADAGG